MPLQVGETIHGRYRIMAPISQGGFGAVYRAWDENLDQTVALKENLHVSPEAQRQFRREATLLANLRHPNLPRVIDHFILPDRGQYLIMDFIEGRSLAELLWANGRPFTEAEVLPWIRQVCSALAYLHGRHPPIIHRDVKPQNIIITPESQAT
jgi:serine/threonine protein kinase